MQQAAFSKAKELKEKEQQSLQNDARRISSMERPAMKLGEKLSNAYAPACSSFPKLKPELVENIFTKN